jgi:hypothetical protein
MNKPIEQLKAVGDVMARVGDLRKARIINEALKRCTVWHKASEELPKKEGTYLVVGISRKVHTAHYYAGACKFSGRCVNLWAEMPEAPDVQI